MVDDTESFWLFMKWIAIDGIFLFGLPALRIPWLEWSSAAMTILFLAHALVDGMLMFKIGVPITSWFVALTKLLYDRELAISETWTKPGDVIHNASLILGRQVIHILPEGSAMLNPQGESFCIDTARHQIQLPIQINQTTPISIELLRMDFTSAEQEIITIPASTVRRLMKDASKSIKNGDTSSPLILRYPVKKTGYYVISKVIDESRLEVQPRRSHAAVVSCPTARVKPTTPDRCRGELSNIALEVRGTPPLKVKYRKSVNQDEAQRASFQSLQPEDFMSPLSRHQPMSAITKSGDIDVSWAQARTVIAPINETLQTGGEWSFDVEEVQDGLGNVVSYATLFDQEERSKIQAQDLQQTFLVHERPRVTFKGCDSQHPLRVPTGLSTGLPATFASTGKGPIPGFHEIEYYYTPEEDILPSGGPSANAALQRVSIGPGKQHPIKEPGLYTLHSVSSKMCLGEVLEPSACFLQNPVEPNLSIDSEDIMGKCAGNPIGKKIYLDLIGTPPFTVQYMVRKNHESKGQVLSERVYGNKGELTLTPRDEGSYEYRFLEVSDDVYKGYSLVDKNLMVEQKVKPPPFAHFGTEARSTTHACTGEPVRFEVSFQGDGPWDLEWELVHAGKRTKKLETNITERTWTLKTDRLNSGGEYTVGLVSVTDTNECKEFLKEEAKVNVRHQRPKGGFAQIEGKYSVKALEGKEVRLPVRLTGESTWTIVLEHPVGRGGAIKEDAMTVRNANDYIKANNAGTYKLLEISDSVCPGSVDPAADTFEVTWLEKPKLHVTESDTVQRGSDAKYTKTAVCEGDEDSLDLSFSGMTYLISHSQHSLTTNRRSAFQTCLRRTP